MTDALDDAALAAAALKAISVSNNAAETPEVHLVKVRDKLASGFTSLGVEPCPWPSAKETQYHIVVKCNNDHSDSRWGEIIDANKYAHVDRAINIAYENFNLFKVHGILDVDKMSVYIQAICNEIERRS